MDREKNKRVYPSTTWKCRRELAAEYCSSTQTSLFWACEKAWQSWAHNLWGYYWGQEGERPTKKKMESGHHWSSQHYRLWGRTAGAGPVCIPRSCQRRNMPTASATKMMMMMNDDPQIIGYSRLAVHTYADYDCHELEKVDSWHSISRSFLQKDFGFKVPDYFNVA